MSSRQAGFTLVELLVVLVISITLFSLSLVNLNKPQQSASAASALDTLLSDLKSQQNLAMSGGLGGTASAQSYGIYLQAGRYTLFPGSIYSAVNPNNFVITLPASVVMTTTLPSTQVVFTKGPGDVQGYVAGSDTVTLTTGSSTHTVTIDRYGALSST